MDEAWRLRLKKSGVVSYRHFGSACGVALLATLAAGAQAMAGAECAMLFAWGASCVAPWSSNRVRKWAMGTREPKSHLFAKMLAAQSDEFKSASPIEQATMARASDDIQRRVWWEASAIMGMLELPDHEHEWRGVVARPGWFDDARAWRLETCAKLEELADRGWICPSITVARLLGREERSGSRVELGADLPSFSLMPGPWPSKARYCETLASMGHKLYDQGFAESLAWRSHGALERMKICEQMSRLGGRAPSKGALRL